MGGDNAPAVEIEGALSAMREAEGPLEVVLVGRRDEIERAHRDSGSDEPLPEIVQADEVIGMHEQPATAVRRKRRSSIVVATELQKRGEVDGLVSAGNTGAVVASSLLGLGMLPNVRRPGIAGLFPTTGDPTVVVDVGASIDSKPQDLLAFGMMGAAYARNVLGRGNPRVGLMNIGEEETKGGEREQAAYALLASSSLEFVGNVEGGSLFRGAADVVVTDGFVGNVMLKLAEGVIHVVLKLLSDSGDGEQLRQRLKDLDYAEYGGAPLLGVDGVVIIAHGGSSAKAIKNAVMVASRFVETDLCGRIVARLKEVVEQHG
ncbi:MAG: phosphate acyltransferase PlsX [Candidatus Eisenbacteria bacterium]|nr:phosphate acyltransferase PlsX [Candidatus Eisenbacteria bacterium]